MCGHEENGAGVPDYPTPREAYQLVAGEMYVPGEIGYMTPREVLADLDPATVKKAEAYARASHLKWPPGPDASGLITTSSW